MEKVNEIIKKNIGLSYHQIAEAIKKEAGIDLSDDAVRGRIRRMKSTGQLKIKTEQKELSAKEIRESIPDGLAKFTQSAELVNLKKQVKELYNALALSEKERQALLTVKGMPIIPTIIKPQHKWEISEAVAVVVGSDWHVEELVDPRKINGLNEYNPDIAKKRAELFFQRALRLIQKEQQDVRIDTVILALLGDFITSNIHEELLRSTAMPPLEAIHFAQGLIVSGINFWLQHSKLKIVVVCHSGNHARITKQVHISHESGNSLEWLMYANMAEYFKNEPRVQFKVEGGQQSYVEVFDKVLRFQHGHNIKYGGGVGGITIPVNKALAQWDRQRQAHYDIFGHFHQYFPAPRFTANGSMIGYNAYALSIKAEYEQPQQALFLIDKKRGKTIQAPILFS